MSRQIFLAMLAAGVATGGAQAASRPVDPIEVAKASAKEMCQRAPMFSASVADSAKITGKASPAPGLPGKLVKLLADFGVAAELKGQSAASYGLAQRDLGTALASGNTCADHVYGATLHYFSLSPRRAGHASTARRTNDEHLARSLEDLARGLQSTPHQIIGEQTTVVVQPGNSGTVIGKVVSVTRLPGQTGPVIGQRITMGGPPPPTTANETIGEDLYVSGHEVEDLASLLRLEATAARNGGATQAGALALLDQVKRIAAPSDQASLDEAQATAAFLPR